MQFEQEFSLIKEWFDKSVEQCTSNTVNATIIDGANTVDERFALILLHNLIENCPLHALLTIFSQDNQSAKALGSLVEAKNLLDPEIIIKHSSIEDEYAFYLAMIDFIDIFILLRLTHKSLPDVLALRQYLVEARDAYEKHHRVPYYPTATSHQKFETV